MLRDVLADLSRQTALPAEVILSVPSQDDLPAAGQTPFPVIVTLSPKGLTTQRNRGMAVTSEESDLFVFFDDDARPHPRYLEAMIALFSSAAGVCAATGEVLIDGAALDREISFVEATSWLEDWVAPEASVVTHSLELYGCNFAVRAHIGRDVGFDESLPLYGWLEDRDFAARVSVFGEVVRVDDAVIVHRGSSSGGRLSHRRFGYSQIANAIYLYRKGSIGRRELGRFMLRGLPHNLVEYVLRRDEREKRLARVQGNLMALRDLARGQMSPSRAAEL